mmetsp:Transcript_44918/g.138477  ORF Transcript_44918/g.138477 Transcript_44918/m.138477 type:complete len:186 (+) Transcript_44918:153-710(+)
MVSLSPPAALATRAWVQRVVVGLALCPWAQPAEQAGKIRYAVTTAATAGDLLLALETEVRRLQAEPGLETTLLVHPQALRSWEEFYPWVGGDAEAWLEDAGLDDAFQVVGFHPGFCFAGEEADDASNWTNRSPFPMTHILRQDSVESAIESHPDPQAVPEGNKCVLRRMGTERLRELVRRCVDEG